ncbi:MULTISPECIES: DUF397 domain-containing protein [unclassified Streptomyces]|uniref:DUF397 domain-containing protein n=1 Tax=unclassified Streptomyces TaxID=2593676 RepID=UPI000DB91C4A|nr:MULTISPECIES: DUF397 domain-containing protein [unclassified Streptomyces]MYT72205.1 DUF397 domain-containing protein [Streptomyces sp. SID8367]RAJ81617.1 uncharacterized protein DUF397 [Streptomyces sp. PsTaAH-137]
MKTDHPEPDLTSATWRKSSYSGGQGGDCLEVVTTHPHLVPIRDSKNPTGPKLVLRAAAWTAFIDDLRRSA